MRNSIEFKSGTKMPNSIGIFFSSWVFKNKIRRTVSLTVMYYVVKLMLTILKGLSVNMISPLAVLREIM